jgi:hypothetical protein
MVKLVLQRFILLHWQVSAKLAFFNILGFVTNYAERFDIWLI